MNLRPAGETLNEKEGWSALCQTAGVVPPLGAEPTQAADDFLRVIQSRSREARLVVREGPAERIVPLAADEVTIGRRSDCQVRLCHDCVSSVHAVIRCHHGRDYVLLDAASRNGVYVNGLRVREHRLVPGDRIRVGDCTLRFLDAANETLRGAAASERRPVVLIPGFSGSELWNGRKRLWPNKRHLIFGSQRQIQRAWEDIRVGSLVRKKALLPGLTSSDSFATLIDFLTLELGYRQGHDLLEFPYDWRQDNRHTAHLLAQKIESWRRGRTNPTEPFVLLAHSMGGIVSRLYLRLFGGADGVERCVFLGTPHLGSIRALRMAIGGGGFPLSAVMERVRRLLLGFPALYQLLPAYPVAETRRGQQFMPFDEEPDWLPSEHRPHFHTAVAVRKILEARAEDEAIPSTCIFGYGQKTPHRMTLQRKGSRLRVVRESYYRSGDGAVPELSATLETAEVHPVVQRHSSLHSDRNVMRHLRYELLERPRMLAAA